MERANYSRDYYSGTNNGLPYHNCPVGKHYKALIDLGAALSLLRYKDCYKTPIQPTTAKLNTADGSPVSALGMKALHLRIAKFKFTHNFIICDQLPEMELIFGIDIQRKFSISYAWDKEKNCLKIYINILLKHSKDKTEKGIFPWWDSNPMPLICWTSTLTTRPQRIPNLSQITCPSDSCSVMPVTIIYRTSSAHPIHAALQLCICSMHLSGWATII